MRKRFINISLSFLLLLVSTFVKAQDPNVKIYIDNPQYISPTIYEFDIAMEAVSPTVSFQLRTFQAGLFMNSSWVNGGTITASTAPGFSEMLTPSYNGAYAWNTTDKLLNCSV